MRREDSSSLFREGDKIQHYIVVPLPQQLLSTRDEEKEVEERMEAMS